MGLRINDMDKATAAKYAIEQKQRDEARQRKENNETWQTKVTLIYFYILKNFYLLCDTIYKMFTFLFYSCLKRSKTMVGLILHHYLKDCMFFTMKQVQRRWYMMLYYKMKM